MNDCFWGCIDNLCDGKDCNNGKDCDNCKEYISLNSEIGRKLEGEFFNDVQKALKPVNEKWGIKKYLFKV